MARSVVVLVALTAMVFGPGVRADILITTSGKEWRGKVTEEGDRYVVELPNGGKIGFPKKVVAEVIEEAALAGKFEAELEEADLTKDEEVNRLCELAEKYGLPEQRGDMLLSAYELRRREAKDDVEALRGLANWCKKYDLQGQAAGCESDANQLEFQARRAAAGEDALALAGLAKWCQECGLKPEAEEAEAAALKIAPDDPEVRKQLGYAWDEARGEWLKARGWLVRLARTVSTKDARYGAERGRVFAVVSGPVTRPVVAKPEAGRFVCVPVRGGWKRESSGAWPAGYELANSLSKTTLGTRTAELYWAVGVPLQTPGAYHCTWLFEVPLNAQVKGLSFEGRTYVLPAATAAVNALQVDE